MKTDEGRARIKVFNGGDDNSDELAPNAATGTSTRFMRSTVAVNAKRRTLKSESRQKNCDEQYKELSVSSDGIKKCSIPDNAKSSVGENNSSVRLRKMKSTSDPVSDESSNGINGVIENVPAQNYEKDNDSDENCKDFKVCDEKLISSCTDNVSVPECSLELSVPVIDGDADGLVDEEEEDEE
ncbi:hypothetical protein K1719_042559 [Acacia pycnantha]|nr:hypothetical protein K1719_042559 [Acacia pycnantha]